MSFMIKNLASPEARGEPDPGIVQTYKARLQALGYSSGLTGKCIRTILHLIAWLSANGTGIETLDVRVLHHFLNHDCARANFSCITSCTTVPGRIFPGR